MLSLSIVLKKIATFSSFDHSLERWKEFATFLSLIIHWRGGISVVFMHKTLEALRTYGHVRYLGYA
jgi:hypothetical protein